MIDYSSALTAIRTSSGVARGDAVAVMAQLALLGGTGHFIGNDLSYMDAPMELQITPKELARAVWSMTSMSRDEAAFELLRAGLNMPVWMPRQHAAHIIDAVASEGEAGHFPANLSPMDFGQALATIVGNADDPSWHPKLIAALRGGSSR